MYVRVTYAHAQYVIGKCALYVGLTLLTIVYAQINIILMGVHSCAILVLLLSFAIMQRVTCEKIYITPSDQPCQTESDMGMQCLTLQQYASSSSFLMTTSLDQTLILAQGTHNLWANLTVSGSKKTAFEMHGTNATIYCNHTSDDEGFYIQDLRYISISGVIFNECKNVNFQSIDMLMITDNGILPHWNQYDQYPLSYWNLNCILNATILRMTFCCNSALQVVWSSLTIEQSVFRTTAVVHVIYTNIAIFKSNFENNYYNFLDSVVRVDNGSNNMQTCSFMSNKDGGKGGAIYISGNNLSVLISETNFTSNMATIGGAIHAEGFDIHLTLIDSTFNGNEAYFCGALKVDGLKHNVSIIRSIFDSNEEHLSLHTQFGGGVACINSSIVTILNCTFTRNLGNGQGGVIHIEHSTLNVWKSIFSGNEAKDLDYNDYVNGGVIYSSSSSVNILINESSFILNKANDNGGVMYIGMTDSQVRIISSDFDHNCAESGKIISIQGSRLDIEDVYINTTTNECLCGVISSCKSNITIEIQQNFTERADPDHSFCTLYDIDSTCHPNNNFNHHEDDHAEDNSPLYPSWPDIQSETTSQTAIAVSLTLLSAILSLVLGITIACIILYRQGKLKFKKWPGLFVNNPGLYVPMNDTDTSTATVE